MKPTAPSFDWVCPSDGAAAEAPAAPADAAAILSAAGRILSARRRVRAGPAKLLPCPGCGRPLTARQRRKPCACGRRWRPGDELRDSPVARS